MLSGLSASDVAGAILIGLINGGFYAILSVGLAVIFGLLNIINFTHGALYMLGAFVCWILLNYFGIGYWGALIIAPFLVGSAAMVVERAIISHVYNIDNLYGLLLTFGIAQIIEGLFRYVYGTSGLPYLMPGELTGGLDLGFAFIPYYRIWVVFISAVVCAAVWFSIERTRLGSYLRAATENSELSGAFGIDVPLLITLTYGLGAALAAFAGVLAAPIYLVNPMMGSDLLIVVFSVVVIGGMGSIAGSIVTGFSLGVVETLAKLAYPPASSVAIFAVMIIVLLLKPAGLFGRRI